MKEIPLRNSPLKAVVDDEDYTKVSNLPWDLDSRGYARAVCYGYRCRVDVMMHHILIKCPKGMVRDHINGETLDNRRCNLRVVSIRNNSCNRVGWRREKSSRYKGVSWHKGAGKWFAQITVHRYHMYLGLFESEREAAIRYNEAATVYFKEFARLNPV